MKYYKTYTGGFDERVSDAVEKRMAKIKQTCLLKAPYLIHYLSSSTLVHFCFFSLSLIFLCLFVNTSLFTTSKEKFVEQNRESFATPLTRVLLLHKCWILTFELFTAFLPNVIFLC